MPFWGCSGRLRRFNMYVSILGDSISTYPGFVPSGHPVFYTVEKCRALGLASVYNTWWAKVNQFLKAYLCINNSYSGSAVAGASFPAACSAARACSLHQEAALPDIILIYIGANDFARGYPIQGDSAACFEYAYETMLKQIKARYPRAWIFCGTLMDSYSARHPGLHLSSFSKGILLEAYNAAIRSACLRQGCLLADLAAQCVTYETLDGAHPTRDGHAAIAQCWINCLHRG